MHRIVSALLEACGAVLDAMAAGAVRTKSRPDHAWIVASIEPLQNEFDAIMNQLETRGMELEELKKRATQLNIKAHEVRLKIRKATGIKSFAALRR